MIQLLMKYFAKKCSNDFVSMAKNGSLANIKNDLRIFNDMRQVSNQTIGCIPLQLIFHKWMLFGLGVIKLVDFKDEFHPYSVKMFFSIT